MCKVDIDVWICPCCLRKHDEFPKPHTWVPCDVGPTYDVACPNFKPKIIKHKEYYCDDCEAALQVLEQAQREMEEQQQRQGGYR